MTEQHDLAQAGSDELMLRSDAAPTISYDDDPKYQSYLRDLSGTPGPTWKATAPDILGPFFRAGAPYRAKISPPNAPGKTLLISGRIWSFETRCPLSSVTVDIWQADEDGNYDNAPLQHPPLTFMNRARLVTDEFGSYEFETIHPGPYKMNETIWRSPHIHYRVSHATHKELTTQLFFRGDPYECQDPFFKASLAIQLQTGSVNQKSLERGIFDIVLVPIP